MQGAREYAVLFETGQHGRLYIVSGSHGRGRTFRIFVLPEGVVAKPNGPNNAPLNADIVEVFGAVDGQPGWSERYGWIHEGPWQHDFDGLVKQRLDQIAQDKENRQLSQEEAAAAKVRRTDELLATYPGNLTTGD